LRQRPCLKGAVGVPLKNGNPDRSCYAPWICLDYVVERPHGEKHGLANLRLSASTKNVNKKSKKRIGRLLPDSKCDIEVMTVEKSGLSRPFKDAALRRTAMEEAESRVDIHRLNREASSSELDNEVFGQCKRVVDCVQSLTQPQRAVTGIGHDFEARGLPV